MMNLLLSILVVIFCFFFSPAPSAAQELIVTVTYTEVLDRILPTPDVTRTYVSLSARIGKSGEVSQSEKRVSGIIKKHDQIMKLGKNDQSKKWRVAGKHQLVNISERISYERAILLTINGGECAAQVAYRLKPGFSDYRYHRLTTGELAVARSVTANDLTCTIQ